MRLHHDPPLTRDRQAQWTVARHFEGLGTKWDSHQILNEKQHQILNEKKTELSLK